MRGSDSLPPSVPLSFSNCFWGLEEKGIDVLHERMSDAKHICEEVRLFYRERVAAEEDYARRLLKISKMSLGAKECGTLKASMQAVKQEVETMAVAHAEVASAMKRELEDAVAATAATLKERRKIAQVSMEKLRRTKQAQEQQCQKLKEKYEADCIKINGFIAQQNMLMGRELDKNNAKLEKAQMAVQTSSISSTLPYTTLKVVDKDYQAASKVLQETTHRWTVEWKAACDKYQDLEEERIDFLKGNLWTFANIMSTVCVSDDEACEKIRVSLEKCEVDEVIQSFVQAKATGQEIPDPPKYKNFYRKEEQDDEAAYKVAQFSRDGNPQYRSSTPQAYAPSDDEMARPMTGMYRQDDDMRPMTGMSMHEPTRPMTGMSVRHEERSMTGMAQRMDESPRPGTGVPRQEDAPRPLTGVPRQDRPSTALPAQSRPATGIPRQDRPSTGIPDSSSRNPSPQRGRPSTMSSVLDSDSPPSSHRSRSRGGSQSPLKGVINEYPEEGITQFCRSDSGRLPPHRNDSRHSSASSTYSSSEAPSQQSANTAASSQGSFSTPNKNGPSPKVLHRPDKSEGKSPTKKSSFWSFTKSPKQSTPKTLPTIQAPLKTSKSAPSGMALTTPSLEIGGDPQPAERYQRVSNARRRDRSEEPIVPGSSVMLNIGDNMLEVNNPDSRPAQPKFEELEDEADPLVAALADLKIASKTPRIPSPSKRDSQFAPSSSQRSDQFQPSSSQRSDHFHPSSSQRSDDLPLYDSPVRDNSSSSRSSTSQTLRQQQPSPSRGQPAQPPPSFDSRRNTLGAPPPAHSAAEMERTRRQYASQVQQVLGGPARPPTSQQVLPPRSTSPRPGSRQSYGGDSYGARPGSAMGMTAGIPPRSRSPNPHEMVPRSRSPAPIARPASRQEYARPSSRQDYAPPRPASRQEYARPASRQEFARPTSRQEYARPTSRQDYDARRRSVSPAPYAGRYDDRSPSPAPVPRSLSPAPRPRSQAAVASNNAFGISLDRYGNVVGDQPAARGGGQYAYGAQHRHDLDLGPGERGAPPPAQQARARSKSQSDVRSRGKYTEDGRLILFAARALYDYSAAIAEECSFRKGDVVFVTRTQDDGWWLGEIAGTRPLVQGLVPSNFFKTIQA